LSIPLITIGITYYRASDTIEDAVASALAQTWDNIEIIIVDDYSNDGQGDVLDRLDQQHDNLKVIRQSKNKGVAESRNEIIRHAKGVFVAFFDDDDASQPDRLSRQYRRITSYEETYANGAQVICHAARTQRYPNGDERHESTMGSNDGLAPHGHDVALRTLTGKPHPNIFGSVATCSQMARLDTYRDLGGFDAKFRRSEDTEFIVRAAINGAHFPGLDVPLVLQTMTLSSDKKLIDERRFALALLEKHQSFINTYSPFKFHLNWLKVKYQFLQKQRFRFALNLAILAVTHPMLTMKRIVWAMPNIGFNLRLIRFYHDTT
jgi:glycosyltransferase involved in cell wall biosynthesis